MTLIAKLPVKIGLWLLVVFVITSPVTVSAAADSQNTVINATVNSVISMTTSSTVAISLTPTTGGVLSSSSDTVTVNTNNTAGYNLAVADADATTSLTSGANNITASAGTKTVPIVLVNGTWGFAVASTTTGIGTNGFDASYSTETNNASSTSKWAGMPASGSPMMLKTTAAVATNDTTTVWFAAKVNAAQPNGVYTDTVTYTATTN